MNAKSVLVTGSAGCVGRAVVKELVARGHLVRGFDLAASPGLPAAQSMVGDLLDVPALERAMQGIDTLIHLAATPDDADFLKELVPNNIVGVYNLFEAARQAGVKRMILASSCQVVWHGRMTGPFPLTDASPLTPRYWYAATKAFIEAAGKAYSVAHDMSVFAMRLGFCPRTAQQCAEIAAAEWARDVYLSQGDVGRFFACAVEAPDSIKFSILYATSIPAKTTRCDLEAARKLIGYEPRDTWPQGTEHLTGKG